MSKADELRALREARYEANRKVAQTAHSAGKSKGKGMQGQRPALVVLDEAIEVCGHMSIGKKRCIRAKDHPEKNHRYGKSP